MRSAAFIELISNYEQAASISLSSLVEELVEVVELCGLFMVDIVCNKDSNVLTSDEFPLSCCFFHGCFDENCICNPLLGFVLWDERKRKEKQIQRDC